MRGDDGEFCSQVSISQCKISALHHCIVRWDTLKSRIIGLCAMSSRIPYLGRGVKVTGKKELLSPSVRHKKTKKHQTLPVEATPMT